MYDCKFYQLSDIVNKTMLTCKRWPNQAGNTLHKQQETISASEIVERDQVDYDYGDQSVVGADGETIHSDECCSDVIVGYQGHKS